MVFWKFYVLNQRKCNHTCIGKNAENDKFKFGKSCLENGK